MSNARNIASIAGEDVLNASNEIVPVYACRAWVNFDGTTNTAGFCTIRDSGNVSTVADNGTGNYTVNFATAMPDAHFSISGSASISTTSNPSNRFLSARPVSTTSLQCNIANQSGTAFDAAIVSVAVLR